eukprot:1336397-Pleurochrysis_carterae.AAC.1
MDCDTIDKRQAYDSGDEHDILRDSVYQRLLQCCIAGEYATVMVSQPCLIFSVSRHFRSSSSPDGGPLVAMRSREHSLVLPSVEPKHARAELAAANGIVRGTTAILTAARDAGARYVLEHPANCGHPRSPIFIDAAHASIWMMPGGFALRAAH